MLIPLLLFIWIGDAQLGQDPGFQAFHLGGLFVIHMVVALRVQHAVDDQMGRMLFHAFLLFRRFLFQHVGAQDDVGAGRLIVGQFFFALVVGKGQHIGGVVFFAVVAVQAAAFFGIDEADGQFSRREQGRLHPAADLWARDQGFQAGIRVLHGQREFIFFGHFWR